MSLIAWFVYFVCSYFYFDYRFYIFIMMHFKLPFCAFILKIINFLLIFEINDATNQFLLLRGRNWGGDRGYSLPIYLLGIYRVNFGKYLKFLFSLFSTSLSAVHKYELVVVSDGSGPKKSSLDQARALNVGLGPGPGLSPSLKAGPRAGPGGLSGLTI